MTSVCSRTHEGMLPVKLAKRKWPVVMPTQKNCTYLGTILSTLCPIPAAIALTLLAKSLLV
jgi:hypothetical protein